MDNQSTDREIKVLICSIVLAIIGLGVIAYGWLSLPIAREQLSIAEDSAPISYSTPIIDSSYGDVISNYRTQDIRLSALNSFRHYRPAPNLWVNDLESVKSGASVRFLVDPASHIIYEAAAEGRTLLAYDDTRAKLNGPARGRMLAGIVLMAIGAFWGVRAARGSLPPPDACGD
ncbi:hypothetical protein [Terrarubrum flagellatum]|uniref:hypothetical protein n=1 Tax=Terrirubrum flagellatum TaxID=2895980 RepID=UPI0031456F06